MTRYPRSGKGRKWTVVELKSIPPAWRGDSLSDGDGLIGEVRVNTGGTVSVRFKYAFKWTGKVAWHQCGTWPTVNMEAIRRQRDTARDKRKAGINPNDHRKADRITAQAKVEDTKTKVEWEVFLSDFALRRFKALHALTGGSAWCFPASNRDGAINNKTVSKQIGDRQMRFKNRRPLQRRRHDDTGRPAPCHRGFRESP